MVTIRTVLPIDDYETIGVEDVEELEKNADNKNK